MKEIRVALNAITRPILQAILEQIPDLTLIDDATVEKFLDDRIGNWAGLCFSVLSSGLLVEGTNAIGTFKDNPWEDLSRLMVFLKENASVPRATMEVGDYTAEVDGMTATVKVGCQTIPFAAVRELANLVDKMEAAANPQS